MAKILFDSLDTRYVNMRCMEELQRMNTTEQSPESEKAGLELVLDLVIMGLLKLEVINKVD